MPYRKLPTAMLHYAIRRHLMESGPRYLTTAELLQCLLGLSAKRADPLAADYESLRQLQPADTAGISHKHGLSENQARLLVASAELGRRLHQPDHAQPHSIGCPADAAQILHPYLRDRLQEHLVVLVLSTRNQVIGQQTIYIGTVNSSSVRPAEVLRPAVVANAPAIVVGHNHPSGDPEPSPADVSVTQDINAAGKLLSIELLDHIIIGKGGSFVSLKEGRQGFAN